MGEKKCDQRFGGLESGRRTTVLDKASSCYSAGLLSRRELLCWTKLERAKMRDFEQAKVANQDFVTLNCEFTTGPDVANSCYTAGLQSIVPGYPLQHFNAFSHPTAPRQ